jgi:hypothetical protein
MLIDLCFKLDLMLEPFGLPTSIPSVSAKTFQNHHTFIKHQGAAPNKQSTNRLTNSSDMPLRSFRIDDALWNTLCTNGGSLLARRNDPELYKLICL